MVRVFEFVEIRSYFYKCRIHHLKKNTLVNSHFQSEKRIVSLAPFAAIVHGSKYVIQRVEA
jgi:hypothetical protein